MCDQGVPPLGSLAQAVRWIELKRTQRILILVGLWTMAVNGFALFSLPNQIERAIRQKQIAPNDVALFQRWATISGYLIYGLPALSGLLFVVLGCLIKQFPVTSIITSLVLYIFATAAISLLFPETMVQGLIVKLIIIYILIRAINTARAFRDQEQQADMTGGLVG
jgi:hypothetical protein